MSVDYAGVGGIGIEITKEFLERLIVAGIVTQEEWDNSPCEFLEQTGLVWAEAGAANYCGDATWYFFVDGDNLPEIIAKEKDFRGWFASRKVWLIQEDLVVIEDLLIN